MAMELERATKKRRGGIDDDDNPAADPTTSSSRSSRVSRPNPSATSSASPGTGAASSPTATTARSSPTRSRASSPTTARSSTTSSSRFPISTASMAEKKIKKIKRSTVLTIFPKDCCNGLLLCLCCKNSPRDESDYVVCNPATQRWIILPEIDDRDQLATIHLGFDPALSPNFHVFAILEDADGCISGVEIFSSETGRWSHRENGWVGEDDHMVHPDAKSAIIAVDTEGKKWKSIPFLEQMTCQCFCSGNLAFIGQSQGHLYYINSRNRDSSILSSFKYNISTSQLFGWTNLRLEREYNLIAIHPECNMIFYVSQDKGQNTLLSYDMDRGDVNWICNIRDPFWNPWDPCLPYVPVFMESLPDHA
uniref:F-box associated beta-propeller type 3 domain-containing protein n=1 Tax=Oryza punctata TaxID=4537 RepID=A0A0E0KY99_ORYPU